MKLLQAIQLTRSGPVCEKCKYFQNDPVFIEETYHGLTVMSSGFGSVRDRDGICNFHQLYLSAGDGCASFALCTSEINREKVKNII
jgi:hypothetical protein